ncbi:hypothetical protein D918_00063 [Trichuris suis]|nr:hypothetical protein D918_00063 [Trichuris suis]
MSRKFDFGTVITTLEKHTRLFPKLLPPIGAPVVPWKKKLKHGTIQSGEGHLVIVRETVTSLFRDERIEIPKRRALVCRPYAERLIQMALAYGDRHMPTMEVCDYFISEKELIHKLFQVYVPRYRNCKSGFTMLYRLPDDYSPSTYVRNPYPPVVEEENYSKSLLNVLLQAYSSRRKKEAGSPPSSDNGKTYPSASNEAAPTTAFS